MEAEAGDNEGGVLGQVDPTLTRADRLVGQVLGQVGALPDVFTELEINFFLLRRLLGVRTQVRLVTRPEQLRAETLSSTMMGKCGLPESWLAVSANLPVV